MKFTQRVETTMLQVVSFHLYKEEIREGDLWSALQLELGIYEAVRIIGGDLPLKPITKDQAAKELSVIHA